VTNRARRGHGETRHLAARRPARRESRTRRHELGHPPLTEIEIGNTTHRVAEGIQPIDMDGVLTMIVGTILWGVVALAMLPFLGSLDGAGRGWWIWTALAGLGLGLIGIEYCRLHRAARQDRASH
jgi:hypothetical protein